MYVNIVRYKPQENRAWLYDSDRLPLWIWVDTFSLEMIVNLLMCEISSRNRPATKSTLVLVCGIVNEVRLFKFKYIGININYKIVNIIYSLS